MSVRGSADADVTQPAIQDSKTEEQKFRFWWHASDGTSLEGDASISHTDVRLNPDESDSWERIEHLVE